MSSTLPSQARAVVVGGGIVGVSVAYHLARRGWTDTVLLERQQLTSGTTWHAAGLLTKLRATYNMTMLAAYAEELFAEVERETGDGTGFRRTGSVLVARTEERWTEVKRGLSMAKVCGFEAEVIDAAEAKRLWPLMDDSGIVGAAYLPADGVANPSDATLAIAKAFRQRGGRIHEHTPATEVLTQDGRVTGVRTADGDIACEVVVNCTGMWGRAFGARNGVTVPLQAAEHFYLVTEPVPDLPPDLPVLRCPDDTAYMREDAGKIMVGFFEPGAKPWAVDGIPEDAAFTRLPEDWEHLAPYVAMAARRLPLLNDIGIKLFFNGPESFTPDDRYILGEAPGLRGYFVAAGFNSVGFQSGGGAGKAVADWIVDGAPAMDLGEVDIRRFMPFQGNRRYLRERTTEVLGLLYDMHWPFRQMETSRGIRRSPLHERVAAAGAVFGEVAGWERANWYAPSGATAPRYEYSFGRQNWFGCSAEEHQAVREAVGLFDQSSFAKLLVQGRDAASVLSQVSANDVAREPGRIVYTQWLNERGGIEADVTVTRLDEDRFLVVSAAADAVRDRDWLQRHVPADAHCVLTDVTSAYAVLNVQGPRSREWLARVSPADFSDAGFPFGTSRETEIGMALARATRVTYVGELGWELMVPTDMAVHVYDALLEAADGLEMRHAGYHALDSLRIEKAYRHMGHDITPEDTPLEAGLGFAVAWDKPGGFIGRDALLRQREGRPRRRLVTLTLDDPEPLLYHNEPIWRDGVLVGKTTSGWYGHTLGRAIALGYVDAGVDGGPGVATTDWLLDGRYEIEIALERFSATPTLRPPYDPSGSRIRG